jgi:glutamate/aspartate transport system substrate-binding protein
VSCADIARGWRAPLAVLLLAGGAAVAAAQSADPAELTGTLAKVRATGTITLGHRESSIPFSYLSARGAPIGYSIDLCSSSSKRSARSSAARSPSSGCR